MTGRTCWRPWAEAWWGDLCGFAAATYLRGVDFIQIPTTLLSQVDSSIGGKTGVDFDAYKKYGGAPSTCPGWCMPTWQPFRTLPGEQLASGMGEVIKHGLIRNKAYYEWLKENRERILARDEETCLSMVLESCRIKRQVVEADPTEQGERALLNFGHTLGHAIEKLSNFSLLHGCAVGLGCIAAARISANRGLISMEEAEGYPQDLRGLWACPQVLLTAAVRAAPLPARREAFPGRTCAPP